MSTNLDEAATITAVRPGQRALIMTSIMLAMVMSTIDATIVNVALPHIQGSLSAAQDQSTWILTSYIIAQMLGTPLVSWLANRIGRKNLLLGAVTGFTAASMACGMATSMPQIVLYRIIQGACAAPFMPLTQAIMFDINTVENRVKATALFGMGVMVGPVLGPVLGGWLTDGWNWRWTFFVNLPFGLLSLAGIWASLPQQTLKGSNAFDFAGFSFLALFLASLQFALDRGPGQAWFDSNEIWAYAGLGLAGLYLFFVQTLTAKHPFFNGAIVKDRNFLIGGATAFIFSALVFSSTALVPAFLQGVLHFPAYEAGLITAPRGIGMMIAMLLTPAASQRLSNVTLIAVGFIANAAAMYAFSSLTLDTDATPIVIWGFLAGFFTGFVFVSMTNITFLSVPAPLRTEAASLYTLIRSIGMAVGISAMQALLVHNSQVIHAGLSEFGSVDNPALQMTPGMNVMSAFGRMSFDAEISRQATLIAFLDDFRVSMFLSLSVLPLLLFLRAERSQNVPRKHEVHFDH